MDRRAHVGPLNVATLIVKPKRHVLHVADLTEDETAELGPLLQKTCSVVTALTAPEQVYVTLWSHAGATPGHIHWVIQPVTREMMDEYNDHGARLQVKMFERNEPPDEDVVQAVSERARVKFTSSQ